MSESDKRQDRIEDSINKLTEIANDLNKIIAVHDQRLLQQEKDSEVLFKMIESRRKEHEDKIQEVYNTIESTEEKVLKEIKTVRDETRNHFSALNQKMVQVEKYMWMAIGGGIAASWLISFIFKALKI
jgi:SpoVK/Ycf46/Vps4 family AAA+-type ATPase